MCKRAINKQEEVIINNNAAVSNSVGILDSRHLSDFQLILCVVAICIVLYVLYCKAKEYLMKVIRNQVVAQNV